MNERLLETLDWYSEAYDDGDHVDISASNIFQEARDEIKRLNARVKELEEFAHEFGILCEDGVVSWSLFTKEKMNRVVEKYHEVILDAAKRPALRRNQ
jgi:hypothetical protein